jgi:hypothetical protein
MVFMRVACVVLAALALTGGCGGRQMLDLPPDPAGGGGAAGNAPVVGPIDLTQAPPTFAMSCDHGVGTITFHSPCLVGAAIGGDGNPSTFRSHEVECTLATPVAIAWSFLVILPPPQNPETVLPQTVTAGLVDLGNGQIARMSSFAGALTFSHVDPSNGSFVARFMGTTTWSDARGGTFSCTVDVPVWAAPGGFV